MMSGYLTSHLFAGHVNYIWAYPWLPAVFWRLERFLAAPTLKRGVLLAAVLAMLFLAGVPQYVYLLGWVLVVRAAHWVLSERDGRRDRLLVAGRAAGWLALGILFASPQLFPTLELLTQMQRGTSSSPDFIQEFPLPPGKIHQIVLEQKGVGTLDYHWERCGFVGGAAFLLMVVAFAGKHRQRHLWAGIALVSLLLAMGAHTPLYPSVVAILPGGGLFRGPGRYLLLFTLGAAVLAGLGFEDLWRRGRPAFRIPAGLLALVAAIQLVAFARDLGMPLDPRTLEMSPENREGLRQILGLEGRVANQGEVIEIGKCQAAGIDQVCGYEPMMLRRFSEIMNAARDERIDEPMVILGAVGRHPVIDMLGVRGWWPPTDVLRRAPNFLPRAWVVNNAVVIESREERLKVLGKGPWDPRKTVILEEYPTEAPPVPTDEAAGRAKVVSRAPGEYVLEAENAADAYLVLSEAYYPGWRAEVDGNPAEVLPANHLIQAIRLPSGKHVVRFSYRSRFLGLGLGVALLAAMVPVAIALVRRRRR
jgi:hypothetical protein